MTGKTNKVQTGDSAVPQDARTADVSHVRATDRTAEPSREERVADQKAWEASPQGEDDHASVEPTEADYEKARTVGIGDEPELPPGKVQN